MATDLLQQLPAEVILEISKHLPDLRSLWAFIRSCPRVLRLLRHPSRSAEVFNAITSNPDKVTPQTRDIIWTVVLLRLSTSPPWPISSFWPRFMKASVLNAAPVGDLQPPKPEAVPLNIVATAARVYDWAQECTSDLLSEFRHIVPQMERLAATNYNREPGAFAGRQSSDAQSQERMSLALAPVSWIEEQVVIRAFWWYQLLLELKVAATRWRAVDDAEMEALSAACISDIFARHISAELLQCQEFLTVCDYVKSRTHGCEDGRLGASVQPAPRVPGPIPHNEYWMYIGNSLRHVEYVPASLHRRSGTHGGAESLVTDLLSPGYGIPRSVFRRHGLALWDNDRTTAMRLTSKLRDLRRPRQVEPGMHTFWPVWLSTLSDEEYARLVKVRGDNV